MTVKISSIRAKRACDPVPISVLILNVASWKDYRRRRRASAVGSTFRETWMAAEGECERTGKVFFRGQY